VLVVVDQVGTEERTTVQLAVLAGYEADLRGLAGRLLDVLAQREALTARLEELPPAHPLAEPLISVPGVGPRTAIEWLRTVGDGSTFARGGFVRAPGRIRTCDTFFRREVLFP
jgi:hypothetical protein